MEKLFQHKRRAANVADQPWVSVWGVRASLRYTEYILTAPVVHWDQFQNEGGSPDRWARTYVLTPNIVSLLNP